MKRSVHIQFKAAFLLIVFAMNTLVGFACAIGLDMAFNSHHHQEEETALAVHVHAKVKKHHHEEAENKHADNDKKDDCCNDKVLNLLKSDKAVPPFAKLTGPIFTTAFIPAYCAINISYPSRVGTASKYYVRGHHPPIPDIRIAIRSFQI